MMGLSVLELLASFQWFFLLHFTGKSTYPKPLRPEEEQSCFRRLAAGGAEAKRAKEQLVLHNLRLVAHVVKKYDVHSESREDLLSIGTIGLLKAVNSYSLQKEVRFSTYAAKCIENEILMKFRQNRKTERDVPLDDAGEEDENGRKQNAAEAVPGSCDVQREAESHLMSEVLRGTMERVLTKRERQVLERRYGMAGGREEAQWEVAAALGISRSYISRIEKAAIQKLRRALAEEKQRESAGQRAKPEQAGDSRKKKKN